ncbi:hypothetical protein [Micromonospora sp. NBC_01813]|uniref:hypothetical protein n=1 Tax=Micromonospora sp. NBC_01813 TaxID=2975988 RepID=UPI002DD8CDFE|nr:hypothetical protein [Micromonospora sp. NBC_01813]WSA10335.1 hypothetical protein OG958_05945 [Micromonospora sp. NBC_01813]
MTTTSATADPQRPRPAGPADARGPYRIALVATTGGGLADPGTPGSALSASELAHLIVQRGGGGRDVQILVPDGAQYAALLRAVADRLGRDVLAVPAGADLSHPAGRAPADPVPTDRTSGRTVDWLLIQPPALATTLPGWFELDEGRVLHRSGWVTLPVPRGLAFTTRPVFPLARAAAASLGTHHRTIATLATAVRDGVPIMYGYGGDAVEVSGTDLAAALSTIPLYGGDLRVWPQITDLATSADPVGRSRLDPADRVVFADLGAEVDDRLAGHLSELAQATGATVWAPPPGSRALLLDGVRDLVVRDRDGRSRGWRAYRPAGPDRPDRFWSDRDGRLAPVGGTMDAAGSGVELVSVASEARDAAVRRWVSVRPRPGLFRAEFAILDDGRLGARHGDGELFALGPAEFRALLRRAGWDGRDVALLGRVAPERFTGLRAHVSVLAEQLDAEVWAPAPGDRTTVSQDQPRALAGPEGTDEPGRWCRLVPAPPHSSDLITVSGRWRSHDGWLVPSVARSPDDRIAPAGSAPTPATTRPATTGPSDGGPAEGPGSLPGNGTDAGRRDQPGSEPVELPPPGRRPQPVRAARGSVGHGVGWLPERPAVNAEQFHLYVATTEPAATVSSTGLSTAEMFVVGQLDADRLLDNHPATPALQLTVGPGGAVAATEVSDVAPAEIRHLLRGVDSYLLPAGWLDRVRIGGYWTPTGPGEWDAQADLVAGPLRLRCVGARHGVAGLPNEVVRWPAGRRGVTAYALLPKAGGPDGDFVALHQQQPSASEAPARLVQLRVEPGQAIDVTASAARMAALVAVRSRLVELNTAGVEVLLPPRAYDRVTVTRVYGADNGRWRLQAGRVAIPLSTLIDGAGPAGSGAAATDVAQAGG